MTARRRLFACAIASGAVLSACGGGGDDPAPAPPAPVPVPAPPPVALPALVADAPARISAATPFDATCTGAASGDVVYLNAEVEPYVSGEPTRPQQLGRHVAAGSLVGRLGERTDHRHDLRRRRDVDADGDPVLALRRRKRRQWRRLPARDRPVGHLRARRRGIPDGAGLQRRVVHRGLGERDARQPLDRRRPHVGTGLDIDPRREPVLQRQELHHRRPDRPALRLRGLGSSRRGRRRPGDARSLHRRRRDLGRRAADLRPGPARSQTIGNVIAVLPNGTVVNVFTRIDSPANAPSSASLNVLVSADKGGSWSGPFRIADALAVGARDPDTGAPIRDGANLPQVAVAPNGHLWVAWQDARFSGGAHDGVALARSTDGGQTWSAPVQVNSAPCVAGLHAERSRDGERHDRRHLLRPAQQYRRRDDAADRTDPRALARRHALDRAPSQRDVRPGDRSGRARLLPRRLPGPRKRRQRVHSRVRADEQRRHREPHRRVRRGDAIARRAGVEREHRPRGAGRAGGVRAGAPSSGSACTKTSCRTMERRVPGWTARISGPPR